MINKNRATRKAWFQGNPDATHDGKITANDPAKIGYPKEVGYERAPMAVPVGEDARPWEQKWFEGAAAVTKKVMGPQGSEFKLKQDWQRIPADEKVANAALSAGFTRTAKPGDSFWTFYATDKKTGEKAPILKATLAKIWDDELSEKTATKSATPEYGKAVMEKIRQEGFSNVAYLLTGDKKFLKKAEGEDALENLAPAGEDMGEDMGADIDADADLGAAIEGEANATASEADAGAGMIVEKLQEVESVQTQLVEQTAPESTGEVFVKLQDAEKMLDEAKEELEIAASRLRDKTITASNKIKLIKLTAEAIEDGISTMVETDSIVDEAIKAANAAIEEAQGLMGGESPEMPVGGEEIDVTEAPADEVEGLEAENLEGEEEMLPIAAKVKNFLSKRAEMRKKAESEYAVVPQGAPKDGKGEISAAHPEGGAAVSNLTAGGKPKDEGEVFETVTEAQDKDLKVVNKMPSGNLASASAKGKVATAAADSATKNFWEKELYGQGDAASKEFGKAMTKDYTSADMSKAASAAASETQAKVVRAYELAEVAVSKGLCDKTAEAKSSLVKKVLAFDDASFVAFKEMLTEAPVKTASSEFGIRKASALPKVGQIDAPAEGSDAFEGKLKDLGWK
jgi:hypothetical protein